jgi:hypothetical protein
MPCLAPMLQRKHTLADAPSLLAVNTRIGGVHEKASTYTKLHGTGASSWRLIRAAACAPGCGAVAAASTRGAQRTAAAACVARRTQQCPRHAPVA